MKKTIQLITLFFLVVSLGISSRVQGSNDNANFNIVRNDNSILHFQSKVQTQNMKVLDITTKIGNFSELAIDGFGSSNIIGEPKLPVFKQLIEVPVGADFDI